MLFPGDPKPYYGLLVEVGETVVIPEGLSQVFPVLSLVGPQMTL